MTVTAPDFATVGDITAMIWSSVLGDDEPLVPTTSELTGERVTGCVHISGGWAGSVLFSCSQETAERVAGALFGMEQPEVSDSEIVDAIGELTNVVGGTIKSILPGPSKLSLPSVISGTGYSMAIPNARQVAEKRLVSQGEVVVVSVWGV